MTFCYMGFLLCRGYHLVSPAPYCQPCKHNQIAYYLCVLCWDWPDVAYNLLFYSSRLWTVCQKAYCCTWRSFNDFVIGRANGPCRLSRKTSMSLWVTDLAISSSAVHNICARTWCTHSKITFACGFLTMVGLCLISYDSHRHSKFSLNSLPLSCIR